MGRSEKRELVSRLTVLLLHLLKWRYQPSRRGKSWVASVANSRDDLIDHIKDNPSLKNHLAEAIDAAYRRARRDAEAQTDLPSSTFPASCPWPFEQIMDLEFWPE